MTEQKKNAINYLKTAKGQLDGIINMINDDRYCIDISNQILASLSLLKKANIEILTGHLNHCVKNAKLENDLDNKIDEIINVLRKLS